MFRRPKRRSLSVMEAQALALEDCGMNRDAEIVWKELRELTAEREEQEARGQERRSSSRRSGRKRT